MPEENWLDFNGHKIYYKKIGSGKTVVLLHGFAEDGRIWDLQIEHLKKDCNLIIPDLPGSGKSMSISHSEENNPESSIENLPTTMDGYADCIKAILDQEKIKSCIMIGHSMGGYISLAFAEKYESRLQGLGLFHSTAYADSEEKKHARKKSIGFIEKYGSSEFIKQSTPNLYADFTQKNQPWIIEKIIGWYDNFDPKVLVSYYIAMMQRPDRTAVLKKFKGPVLFVIGENDNAVPLESSLQQCHIPDLSYLHILSNTGHMGMLESTPKTNKILKSFINDIVL